MKKLKLLPLLSLVFLLNVAFKCTKDDDNSTNQSSALQQQVINTVSSGTWKVTFYEEKGVDHTSFFTGFSFTFGPKSVLTAVNGTNTYTGSWSVTTDDKSSDDNPKDDVDFNIAFSSPSNFAELTEDWSVLSVTNTVVKLKHVSGGNGGTSYLTLEKI
jgi:hypothetical protein